MSLSIRQWLAEHNIAITQLQTPGAQTAGVAFRIVQDMEVKSLAPFDISPFAELLELPLTILWQDIDPVCRLSAELLRTWSRKKPLKRNEGTWLAFQIAYLRAFQKILEQEFQLQRVWLTRANVPIETTAEESRLAILFDPQLQALVKTMRPGRLSDTQAEQALSMMGESLLVGQMNNLAIAWFLSNGLEETSAKLVVQRLVHSLPGYLLAVIAENPLPLAQLQRFVRLGNLANNPLANQILTDDETISIDAEKEFAALGVTTATPSLIDLERELYRATLLENLCEPLLGELYALKDLFVPLKAALLEEQENRQAPQWDRNSSFPSSPHQFFVPSTSQPPVDLMEWATSQLSDLETVAIIEGEAGQGKTSFCQIWSAKIAQDIYPTWMPVWIRLRDVTLGKTLEQTLDSALKVAKFSCADGWLEPLNPPCLLILDGLDELSRFPGIERQVSAFLEQVRQFQRKYAGTSGRPRHKIFLTCRYGTLNSLAHSLPGSFRRVLIQPFEQEQLKQWFKFWAKLQPKSTAQAYFNFLKQSGVFRQLLEMKDLTELVHQPLPLLLLGLLYRDGRLDESIFTLRGSQVRFEVYDRLCRWFLGQPPDGMPVGNRVSLFMRQGMANSSRTTEAVVNLLQGRSPEAVRTQMQAAALTLLQSGRQSCSSKIISDFLTKEKEDFQAVVDSKYTLPALYFQLSQPTRVGEKNTLSSSFVSLSSYPNICFSHPRLGEYLCGEGLAQVLKSLIRKVADSYGEVVFAIDSPTAVAEHLYKLLGYGILSVEIQQLAIERLQREESRDQASFSFAVLLPRLYGFYRAYCRSKWLDEGVTHATRSYFQSLGNSVNVLQIEAAVGLNIFLLLSVGHQVAQMPFYPCGDPNNSEDFDPDRFLSLIGRTTVLAPDIFWQRSQTNLMLLNLTKACLNYAMLPGANFWKTNFFGADLIGANLAGANLQEANLSGVNLANANLSGANLSAAKLEGANLSGANLLGANLQLCSFTNACLFEAQLDDITRDLAEKGGALFSLKQYRACQQAMGSLSSENRQTPKVSSNKNANVNEADATILLIEREESSTTAYDENEDDRNNDETIFI